MLLRSMVILILFCGCPILSVYSFVIVSDRSCFDASCVTKAAEDRNIEHNTQDVVPSKTTLSRRKISEELCRDVAATLAAVTFAMIPNKVSAAHVKTMRDYLRVVKDPNSYSAISYANPKNQNEKVPLLVVLHGAGKNQDGVESLKDIQGEHAGLIPSLIENNKAPSVLTDNFAVVAPYAAGKRSFYEEPRSKLLKFVDWMCSEEGRRTLCCSIDVNRIFLFGFSDGATVAVELATTGRFKACIICAYGYSGTLPDLALQRLEAIPFWVFHSCDDVIFPVSYSDQLVKSLRRVSRPGLIRYTRYEADQEGFTGAVRGHSVGITASKLADIYQWMLSMP